MRKNKSLIKTQRKSLDEKLKSFSLAKSEIRPKSGWIKAIREALGMTTTQLAERLQIKQSGVVFLEKREVEKKVTLETLERAAHALNCELVYALVPKTTLEHVVDYQAQIVAQKILKRTTHTMHLEQQEAGAAETELHEAELANELKSKLDRRLWGGGNG
ncbi:MAG: mobile mystery protein A [Bdellovibrionia bacterium]